MGPCWAGRPKLSYHYCETQGNVPRAVTVNCTVAEIELPLGDNENILNEVPLNTSVILRVQAVKRPEIYNSKQHCEEIPEQEKTQELSVTEKSNK